jgi:hypothetical protein
MTARDDYPTLYFMAQNIDAGDLSIQCGAALDEIDTRRAKSVASPRAETEPLTADRAKTLVEVQSPGTDLPLRLFGLPIVINSGIPVDRFGIISDGQITWFPVQL